jgi:hypothetical protein
MDIVKSLQETYLNLLRELNFVSLLKGASSSQHDHRQPIVRNGHLGRIAWFLKEPFVWLKGEVYLELVYLVTALVPSDTACFASSPGSSRRTAVWISLEVMVRRLL